MNGCRRVVIREVQDAAVGDQQAAAIGQGGVRGGDVCLNYGTGAFALFFTGETLVRCRGLLSNLLFQLISKIRNAVKLTLSTDKWWEIQNYALNHSDRIYSGAVSLG